MRTARFREQSDAPRRHRETVVDFSALPLPADVRRAFADAFWNHYGSRPHNQLMMLWAYVKVFARFATEGASIRGLGDFHHDLLVRYIEWLNAQRRGNGDAWTKASRASAYTALRTLLQWLTRCRPGVLGEIHYPFNPFPWRNRDSGHIQRLSARELRAILKACERDIQAIRTQREEGERAQARVVDSDPAGSLGGLLNAIDQRFGGILPKYSVHARSGMAPFRRGLIRFGGGKRVEPYLYPTATSLLPYYLAIMIHSAGNPEPIAHLANNCVQPIPLLDDRQMLIWSKPRAGRDQHRSFRSTDPFEPPALVRELIDWTGRLRAHAPKAYADRLLLYKSGHGITAWSSAMAKSIVRTDFRPRHGLPHFSLASIRPSVLSAFYRASGDLQQVKAVANHRQVSTTVRYVQGPEVEAQHRVRIAALQSAFLGHIRRRRPFSVAADKPTVRRGRPAPAPAGRAVSMFGFDCKDPFAGIAPDSRRDELCTNFLGCFMCPNAIITSDAASVARLLQARDHLRASVRHRL